MDFKDTLNLGAHKGDTGLNLPGFSTISVTNGTEKKRNTVMILLLHKMFAFTIKIKKFLLLESCRIAFYYA